MAPSGMDDTFSRREHHFYVTTAKFLFKHDEYGIVVVGDPIRLADASSFGLKPLLLYGITVAGLPLRWLTFSLRDEPLPLQSVLAQGWRCGDGLRGPPDILHVSKNIAAASPDLINDIKEHGIGIKVADRKQKSLPASMRSAQTASKHLFSDKDRRERYDVQGLCNDAQHDHEWHCRLEPSYRSGKERDRICAWLALPRTPNVPEYNGALDWQPGKWLESWESQLPPVGKRYFSDDNYDGRRWLFSGYPPSHDAELEDDEGFILDNLPETVSNLLGCWPNKASEVAKALNISTRELRWFAEDKLELSWSARVSIERLLGIEFSEMRGGYTPKGPYILVASNKKSLGDVYEDLSGGGDACPFEIVPSEGSADPSWRYFVINPYAEDPSLVMAPRGERITEYIPDVLFNFEGIRSVDPKLYKDVVATCGRAGREPSANVREMKSLIDRHTFDWY